MGTLEITLRLREGGAWPVVAEYSGDAELYERSEGTLALDEARLLEATNDPAAYGQVLGEALFQASIGKLFQDSLIRAGAQRLRLLLFVEDEALRAKRWERLCVFVEGGWQPLATYQRVPFSRYLPSQTDRRFPPIGRNDLRALVVAASPAGSLKWGLPPFDAAAAVAGVTAAYTRAAVPFTLLSTAPGADGPPTLAAIRTKITRERITTVHIVAHGRNLVDGPVIYLSSEENPDEADGVTATRLIESLNDLQSPFGLPHLVFLCACDTAQEEHNGSLGGLGQRLVQQLGTPAVVAMADRVSVETATNLSAAFYDYLLAADSEAEGEVDVALVQATAGLAEREDVTVPVLYQRLGSRPLFTRATLRPPEPAEVAAGLTTLEAEVKRRAPVLLPELSQAAATVRAHLATPEPDLTPEVRAEVAEARATIATICAEAVELTFDALATGATPARYEGDTPPFPGLTAFAEPQQRFFFGRDALVAAMLAQLDHKSFLAVSGASGSGKSSAVLAGLAPQLRAKRPGLGMAYLTPGELPLASLERAVFAAQQGGTRDLVVVIDQFEELFLLGESEEVEREERKPFIDELRRLAGEQTVIILLQTDYLEACGRYPGLNALMTGSTVQVQPLSAEELREAAERQAGVVGLRFEAGLPTIILNDVSGERGVMPLAQHALRELWQRRRGRWLRTSEYVELGGIREAIARTADQIVARQDPASRERVREFFLRLTRLDRDVREGDEPSDTRQRVHVGELVPAGEDPEPIEALLRQLTEARLIVRNGDIVEVAHEALIRSWRRLRQWIADDRQLLIQLEDLRHDALKWDRGGRAEYFLWAGGQLARAEALAELPRLKFNTLERAFLDASIQARQREQEAQRAQLEEERRLRAEAEASRKQAYEEAEKARQAATVAEQARALADQSAREAQEAREKAIEARGRAEANRERAVEAATEAERQRDIAKERAKQLRRRFWIVTALAGLASLLTIGVIWQFGEARRQSEESRRQAIIAQSRADLSRGDPDDALATAAQAQDDLRLNAVLAAAAGVSARRIHHDFGDSVYANAFSPDGATYLGVSADGWLRIWNTASGELVRSYRQLDDGEPTNIVEAIYGPDGPLLGLSDGRIIAVGAADATPFAEEAGGEITALAASPDGAQLLTSDASGEAVLWDLERGTRLRTVGRSQGFWMQGVAYIDNGRAALTFTEDGLVTIYDTATWEERSSFELRRPDRLDDDGDQRPDPCMTQVGTTASLADGELLLVGCNDGVIEAWTLEGELSGVFFGHDTTILAIAPVSGPAGVSGLVSSSYDQTVRLWSLDGRTVRTFQGHDGEVYGLAVSPDGSLIVSGAFDNTVRLWDTRPGLSAGAYALADGALLRQVVALAALPDGRVEAADIGGMLAAWDAPDSAPTLANEVRGQPLTISADGRRALIMLPDDTMAFWDVAGNLAIASFDVTLPMLPVATLSADGSLGMVSLADGSVELRSADGALVQRLAPQDDKIPRAIAISPDRARALVGYQDGDLGLWSLTDGTRVGDWLSGHGDEAVSLAFSSDGRKAISGSWDRRALVWDLERRVSLPLIGHTRTVWSVAFSPDGNLVLTGSADGSAKVWRVADGLELATYGGHLGSVDRVVFDPDGQSVLTGSTGGEVRRWQILVGDELWAWLRANRALP